MITRNPVFKNNRLHTGLTFMHVSALKRLISAINLCTDQ